MDARTSSAYTAKQKTKEVLIMNWGNPRHIHEIDSYENEINWKLEDKKRITLKAGTKINTGMYQNDLYIKEHRNGHKTLNIIRINYRNRSEMPKVVKIAYIDDKYIHIKNPKFMPIQAIFELTILQPRTLGFEHVLCRQNSLHHQPVTKIRMDKPIKINLETNEITQDTLLKKRVYDKQLIKEYKKFLATFKFEFNVIAKMELFKNYLKTATDSTKVLRSPIKIKSVTYDPTKQGIHRWTSEPQKQNSTLYNTKWLHINLTKKERLDLAMLTLLSMTSTSHYNYNIDSTYSLVKRTAQHLVENPFHQLGNSFRNEEIFKRHLGIVKYEEQI